MSKENENRLDGLLAQWAGSVELPLARVQQIAATPSVAGIPESCEDSNWWKALLSEATLAARRRIQTPRFGVPETAIT